MVNIQIFYSLKYQDDKQSIYVGIIEHNSETHREYIYMLSPDPGLDRVVQQDYLTNLYHFAWILNALNDKHLDPAKFGIKEPLDWLCAHNQRTANTILAIDDHFQLKCLPTNPKNRLSHLYEDKVARNKRKLLSNLDVR